MPIVWTAGLCTNASVWGLSPFKQQEEVSQVNWPAYVSVIPKLSRDQKLLLNRSATHGGAISTFSV